MFLTRSFCFLAAIAIAVEGFAESPLFRRTILEKPVVSITRDQAFQSLKDIVQKIELSTSDPDSFDVETIHSDLIIRIRVIVRSNRIWMCTNLRKLAWPQEMTREQLLLAIDVTNGLSANQFCFDRNNNLLGLYHYIDNRAVTDEILRKSLRDLQNDVVTTRSLWEPGSTPSPAQSTTPVTSDAASRAPSLRAQFLKGYAQQH